MNVPFVTFQCRDLKVFRVLYLQANRGFQKIITQAWKNIFHAVFYILCISTRSFRIMFFGPSRPPSPCGLNISLSTAVRGTVGQSDSRR